MTAGRSVASRRIAAGLAVTALLCSSSAATVSRQAETLHSAATSVGSNGVSTALGIPTAPDQAIDFRLLLHLPGDDRFQHFLADVADPTSPSYRQYLQPAEFGPRFGLPSTEVDRVVAWVQGHGMRLVTRDPDRIYLTVEASAQRVRDVFATTLYDRVDDQGRPFHVPDREPRVPPAIAAAVDGVAGLDTEPIFRPSFRPPLADVPNGSMGPADLALAYDIKPLHDANIDGTNQTVAIISLDSFLDADVHAFEDMVGLTRHGTVEHRPVPDGYVPTVTGNSIEVDLDIDVIRAIAPMATIIDYEAANQLVNFADMIDAIMTDRRATIATISWGACEARLATNGFDHSLIDREFGKAAGNGITIFAASGDAGAYDCIHALKEAGEGDTRITAEFPATSPSVVAVGGTFLWVRQDGSYLKEAAWEDSMGKEGSGGGVSTFYDRPDWQQAANVDMSPGAGRQIPDVAGPADPQSAMRMMWTPPSGGSGPLTSKPIEAKAAGTSAASPFWAGSMVLVEQLAGRPLGQLGPTLYRLAAQPQLPPIFHDVVLGGDLLQPATTGWDTSTGLGTPDVTALADAIVRDLLP